MQSINMTYSRALNELEQIVQSIESQEADIDELTDKVKRATELIVFCNQKLKGTQEDINKILAEPSIS